MFQETPPASNSGNRVERFIASGDSVKSLTEDLDHAIERGDVPVARALSPLLMEIEERRGVSMSLAKAYLRNSSAPIFEAYQTLKNGHELSEELSEEIDDAYEDTARHIQVLMGERQRLPETISEYYQKVHSDLTGGITELVTFALINRNGRYINHLAIPSTNAQDAAGHDYSGRYKGVDFNVFKHLPEADLENPVPLQVKTGTSSLKTYQSHILTIALNQLTPSTNQAYSILPQAIINDATYEGTSEDTALIEHTTAQLTQRLDSHYDYMRHRKAEEAKEANRNKASQPKYTTEDYLRFVS